MIGRFWFYRRRRVLPFMAAYCLVSINGATLAPLALPASRPGAVSASADGLSEGARCEPWSRLHYQRGTDDTRPQSVAAATLPPIVKNLRRSSPERPFATGPNWCDGRVTDPRGSGAGFAPRGAATNAADLTRLCRLLI